MCLTLLAIYLFSSMAESPSAQIVSHNGEFTQLMRSCEELREVTMRIPSALRLKSMVLTNGLRSRCHRKRPKTRG